MIKLWGKLAETGWTTKERAAFSVSPSFTVRIRGMAGSCPCCEYARGFTEITPPCRFCPVDEWRNGFSGIFLEPCLYGGHPKLRGGDFGLWCESRTKVWRQYYANRILVKALMMRVGEE
jgi:hypothetical protein